MASRPGSFATSSDVSSDHVHHTANADPPDTSQVNGLVNSAAVEWALPIPPCFDQGHGGASVSRVLDSTPVHSDGASVKLDCAVVGKHMVSPEATSKSLEIGTVDRTLAGSSLKRHRFSEQKKRNGDTKVSPSSCLVSYTNGRSRHQHVAGVCVACLSSARNPVAGGNSVVAQGEGG